MTGGGTAFAPTRSAVLAVLLAPAPLACGRETAVETGASTNLTTAPEDTSQASGSEPFCSDVIEGDLTIRTLEDVEAARRVVSVGGELTVFFQDLEDAPSDLSFLECLESVARMTIASSPSLISTAGAARLREVSGRLRVAAENLRSLTGFDSLEQVGYLDLESGPSLEVVDLRSTRRIGYFHLGLCPGNPPMAWHNWSLLEDGVFDAIEEVDTIRIRGNAALSRVALLDALAANGAAAPGNIEIAHNPMLPEAEVLAQVEALGGPTGGICGNRDSLVPPTECGCASPD